MKVEDFELEESAIFVFSGENQSYDIDNMHPRFLVSRGVIPSDWKKNEYESLSSYSELSYENGISLYVDDEILRVIQAGDLEFGEEYKSVELLTKYLISVERDTLGGLIFRWRFKLPHSNPHEWVRNRFVCPEITRGGWEGLSARISLDIDTQEHDMFYTFFAEYSDDEAEEERGYVNILCGIRQGRFENNDELIGWLSNWRKHEETILQTTTLLCGGDFNA